MAMVSLHNRQIDVVSEVPDEQDRATLKDEFVDDLEDACDDPRNCLLGPLFFQLKKMEVFE